MDNFICFKHNEVQNVGGLLLCMTAREIGQCWHWQPLVGYHECAQIHGLLQNKRKVTGLFFQSRKKKKMKII